MKPAKFPLLLFLGAIFWGLLSIGCQPEVEVPAQSTVTMAAPTRTPLQPPSANKMGIHLLLDDGRTAWPIERWPAHMHYARQLVGEWGYITQLVRSEDLDIRRWQYFMDLCGELQLTPIIRLGTVYNDEHNYWEQPPVAKDDRYHTIASQYAEFIAGLDWPTSDHYIIIGNEPNHSNEWGGNVDPAAYARFFLDTAQAIRQADPNARIMLAPLDMFAPHTGAVPFADGRSFMDAESFMDAMVQAEPDIYAHVDALASHSYALGAFKQPPWEQTFQVDYLHDAFNPAHRPPPEGIHNRGINGYEWELWKLGTYGIDDLPVFITETGWRKAETTNPAALDGSSDLPDAATVAVYLDLAYHGNDGRYPELPKTGWTPWLDDPRVVAVTPFALNGLPAEWGHTNWLQLDAEGNVLGQYAMFDTLAESAP
jgi:hypothetical protein